MQDLHKCLCQLEEINPKCTSAVWCSGLTWCPQFLLAQAALSRGSGGPSHWGRGQGSKGCTAWTAGSAKAEQTASIIGVGVWEKKDINRESERAWWNIAHYSLAFFNPTANYQDTHIQCCTVAVTHRPAFLWQNPLPAPPWFWHSSPSVWRSPVCWSPACHNRSNVRKGSFIRCRSNPVETNSLKAWLFSLCSSWKTACVPERPALKGHWTACIGIRG